MSTILRCPRRRMPPPAGLVAALGFVGFWGTMVSKQALAEEPSVRQCLDAAQSSLTLRRAQKIREALTPLDICMASTCPEEIRVECIQRKTKFEALVPTVLVDTRVVCEGQPVAGKVAVQVTVDGQPLNRSVEGEFLPLDPGPHVFAAAVEGQPSTMQTVQLAAGEKGRRVVLTVQVLRSWREERSRLREPAGSEARAEAQASGRVEETNTARGPAHPSQGGFQRTAALVLGATGVTGLTAGSVLGLMAMYNWSDSKASCSAAACSDYEGAVRAHDRAVITGTASTVAFVAGGIGLVAGVGLWLWQPTGGEPAKGSRAVRVVPMGSGGLGLEGRF